MGPDVQAVPLRDTSLAKWLVADSAGDVELPRDAASWEAFRADVTRAGLAGLMLERAARWDGLRDPSAVTTFASRHADRARLDGARDPSAVGRIRPEGAPECSHGWSPAPPDGTRGLPGEEQTRPGGAAELLPTESPPLALTRDCGAAVSHVLRSVRPPLVVPDAVRESLQRTAMLVAASNLAMAEETSRLIEVLSEARIPVMLLKGAALNLTVYDRPDLRPMSDVDLLVAPRDADRAVDALLRHGCRSGAPLLRSDFFPKYYYETELTAGIARPVRIDLHARPFRPLRLARTIPDDAFWDAPAVKRLGRTDALIPRPEIMFIHLAAHAAFHGCSRLLWLYDIHRLVERYVSEIDWDEVGRLTERWRLSLAVSAALTRVRTRFGTLRLDDLIETLRRHSSNWRDRLTIAHAPRDATAPLTHVAVNLLCTPGWGFKLGYLRAVAFPGRAHLAGIYRGRHVGWAACAHAWRGCRAIRRWITA